MSLNLQARASVLTLNTDSMLLASHLVVDAENDDITVSEPPTETRFFMRGLFEEIPGCDTSPIPLRPFGPTERWGRF